MKNILAILGTTIVFAVIALLAWAVAHFAFGVQGTPTWAVVAALAFVGAPLFIGLIKEFSSPRQSR